MHKGNVSGRRKIVTRKKKIEGVAIIQKKYLKSHFGTKFFFFQIHIFRSISSCSLYPTANFALVWPNLCTPYWTPNLCTPYWTSTLGCREQGLEMTKENTGALSYLHPAQERNQGEGSTVSFAFLFGWIIKKKSKIVNSDNIKPSIPLPLVVQKLLRRIQNCLFDHRQYP